MKFIILSVFAQTKNMEKIDSLMKELVGSGLFGPGRFSYLKVTNNPELQHYPDISYCDVGVEQGPVPKTVQLAIKTQQRPDCVRRIMDTDKLFSNELAMYKVILPFLKADDLAPRFFHGRATLGAEVKKDLLILEDTRSLGFAKSKGLYLDYHEIAIAMKSLGRFHGFSYKAKNLHASMFSSVSNMLQSVIPGDEQWDVSFRCALERGIRPLMGRSDDRTLLQQVLNRLYDPRKAMKSLRTPKEPFGVIYHGDFHKENILFHYNEKGNATDCVFIDFQMSLYCDPSIDITCLLYMNTTADIREKHWDEFLKIYWKGVTSVEPNPGFTYDQFIDNFSRKAIYGYFPSSIFLARALSNDPKGDSTEHLSKLSVEDRARKVANMGGTEATNILSKIVKHLMDRGYLEKYIHSDF